MEAIPSTNVQRKFHPAEMAWAQEQLYGTPSKCGQVWKHCRWIGAKVDKVRNSAFAKRHFTLYGKHQALVAHAIAKNRLSPTNASEAALHTAIDGLVSFIEQKSSGFKTFDRSDNRALLLYTAKQDIVETSPVFEEAFYKRVVQAQVRMQPSQSDGIDIVRDLDTIVAGIEQISSKNPIQIQKDASIEFGYQWEPEALQNLSNQTSLTTGQRTPEEIRNNILLKADILVHYSTSPITQETLQQVLGEEIVHITNPEEFADALNTMRLAAEEKEELTQSVTKTSQEHTEAKLALTEALKDLEQFEQESAIRRNNPGLFGIIDPVLAEMDAALITLITRSQDINAEAIKGALGSREVLIDDIETLAVDLKKLGKQEEKNTPDLDKAQVKLSLRQHFTLDKPVDGIQSLLEGVREPSPTNPQSTEIKEYLVAQAEREYNEQRIKVLQTNKEQLLQKQDIERKALQSEWEQKRNLRQQDWNDKLGDLEKGIAEDKANNGLKKAIENFLFIQFPTSIKEAKARIEQVKELAQNATKEVCEEQEKESPNRDSIRQNQNDRDQLENKVLPALKKWIQKEEFYFKEFDIAAKTHNAKLQKVDQYYKTELESLKSEHEAAINSCAQEIFECSAQIDTLKQQIKHSDDLRSTSHGTHTLNLEYICDLSLRLNTASVEPSEDPLADKFKTLVERLKPFIASSVVGREEVNGYLTKVLAVIKIKEEEQAKDQALTEAKEDLSGYLEMPIASSEVSIQDYLDNEKAVLKAYVEDVTAIHDVLGYKNAQVAGRVNTIYEHVIQHTWDEMTKAVRVETIWRNATAGRLIPLVADISGRKALHSADIALLERAREFAPQTSLKSEEKQAIQSADVKANTSWTDEIIRAYNKLLTEVHKLILKDKLQFQKTSEEVLPLSTSRADEKEEEIALIRKAHQREPAPVVNKLDRSGKKEA